MEEKFEPLDHDEVLFVRAGRVLMANPTFKVGEFIDSLAQAVSDREADWAEENEGWFGDGLECEVLRFDGRGWQRGRVRIRLEFCPEQQPERKLLDARRSSEPRRSERSDARVEDVYRPDKESYRMEREKPRLDDIYEDDE
jgi:hypothetical protein